MFKINNTLSFNTDRLTTGNSYDYVTRTSQNQGILQGTGFINKENINPAGNWSLGLLQMDFFYRPKPWYAGQFVRKIIPKIEITKRSIPFFSTIFNKQKNKLLSVLVRDVDKTFSNINIQLPIKNNQIDFELMESFIAELEAERIAELEAYLLAAGLKDCNLTPEEQGVIEKIKSSKESHLKWFKITDLFNVKNSRNILARDIIPNSGDTPYLCASAENNAVSSYISYDKSFLDKGNCVFIGGKTFVVTYQEKSFYSNDSHNLILYLKEDDKRNKLVQLYLASSIYKCLNHKYSWGDSISNRKIQGDEVLLPVIDGKPDYQLMETLISAVQKMVIKGVVNYADKKLTIADHTIQQSST